MGILVAVPIFISANKDWWPKVHGFEILGIIFFILVLTWLYRSVTIKPSKTKLEL